MTPGFYNQNMQLFQTPDHVVVLNEMVHDSRIIPLDGRPRPDIESWTGESRGHWEGDTLVVETTHLSDRHSYRGSTSDRRLFERFTRIDAETVLYEFTIDDPGTWTAQIPMRRNPLPLSEYALPREELRYGEHPGGCASGGAEPGGRAGLRNAVLN